MKNFEEMLGDAFGDEGKYRLFYDSKFTHLARVDGGNSSKLGIKRLRNIAIDKLGFLEWDIYEAKSCNEFLLEGDYVVDFISRDHRFYFDSGMDYAVLALGNKSITPSEYESIFYMEFLKNCF